MQEIAGIRPEPAPNLECSLSAAEIAEVFIQVLGGADTAEDAIGWLMVDCNSDDRDYWERVMTALRCMKSDLEQPWFTEPQ